MGRSGPRERDSLAQSVTLAGRLLGSSLGAQLAVLTALAMLLPRLEPRDLALFGVMGGIGAVTASLSTWAAETRAPAVPDEVARSLLRGGASINLAVGGMLVVAGAAVCAWSWGWGTTLVLAGFNSVTVGRQRLLTASAMREGRAVILSRWRLVQGLTNAALMLVAQVLVPYVPGHVLLGGALVASTVVGNASITTASGLAMPKAWPTTRADLRTLRKEVGPQPLANLLAGLVLPMPQLLLPALGQVTLAGSWAVLGRFLVPVVNTAVSTVQPIYYQRSASLLRAGDLAQLRRWYLRWCAGLLAIALVAAVGFTLVITFGLPLLGPQWREAIEVRTPAVIFYSALLLSLPLSQTLLLLREMRLQLVWTIGRALVCVVPFVIAPLVGAGSSLTLWAVASVMASGVQLWLTWRALHRHRGGSVDKAAATSAGPAT